MTTQDAGMTANPRGLAARRVVLVSILVSALVGACAPKVDAPPISAPNAVRIGLTATLTGPNAAAYAPVYESINVYVQRLNDLGGIDGRRVELIVEDDAGDATRASTNATRLVQQEHVPLLVLASPSASYGPVMSAARGTQTPLLIAAACPRETLPPADPLMFCSSSYCTSYDSAAAVRFIHSHATGEVKLGLIGVDIPVSRAYMDSGAEYANAAGLGVVTKQIMPLTVTDFSPFATQVVQADANWAWAGGPWGAEVGPFEALQKLAWTGNYVLYGLPPAEEEFRRRRVDALYGVSSNALFAEDLPIHNDIRAAAQKYGATYPVEQLAEGWVTAMVLEEAVRTSDAPFGAAQLRAALDRLDLDTHGLRGTRMTFTPENHFRTQVSYRVYHWDSHQQRIVIARDWDTTEVAAR
jgi:branched-chain amino acid transport system substrate-binding protein